MKQILTIFILTFFLNPTFGQKYFDIPETKVIEGFIERLPKNFENLELKDLRTSVDSLNIRIWQKNNVFTLNYKASSSSDYKLYTTNDEVIFKSFDFSENQSQQIMDSFIDAEIMNLRNEKYRGIDGSFVFIEISTKSKYKVVSYWSPSSERSSDCQTVVQILNILEKSIDSRNLQNEFLNSLSSGNYSWGMKSIRVDRFLDQDTAKSDFYSQFEEKVRLELSITDNTNHWDYPLILVDSKPAMISTINKYNKKQISKFEVIKPDNQLIALYGTRGSNGIVMIETK